MKFLTIFNEGAGKSHLYKDVGMIAYSLSRYCGWQTSFASLEGTDGYTVSDEHYSEYVQLVNIPNSKSKLKKSILFFKFLYYVAHNYDVVSFISLGVRTRKNALILKLLNPKIKIYVKADATAEALEGGYIHKFNKNKLRAWFLHKLENCIDLYSFETPKAVERAIAAKITHSNVICVPNGYLEDLEMHYKEHSKENIIITVGRIGHVDKYNELLVDAIKNIDKQKLCGWQVCFVGPVTAEFEKYVHDVCADKEYLKKVFVFTGTIDNKPDLYKIYAKAKVFCMTSRREGFANVFPEALSFGDYVITADIPVAYYVTNNRQLGKIFPMGDAKGLQLAIEEVLDGKIDLHSEAAKAIDFAKTKLSWQVVIKPLAEKLEQLK